MPSLFYSIGALPNFIFPCFNLGCIGSPWCENIPCKKDGQNGKDKVMDGNNEIQWSCKNFFLFLWKLLLAKENANLWLGNCDIHEERKILFMNEMKWHDMKFCLDNYFQRCQISYFFCFRYCKQALAIWADRYLFNGTMWEWMVIPFFNGNGRGWKMVVILPLKLHSFTDLLFDNYHHKWGLFGNYRCRLLFNRW